MLILLNDAVINLVNKAYPSAQSPKIKKGTRVAGQAFHKTEKVSFV